MTKTPGPINTFDKFKYQKIKINFLRDRLDYVCSYCSKDLRLDTSDPKIYPTIDHWKPKQLGGKFYSKDNFKICCLRCNQIRNTLQMGLSSKNRGHYFNALAHSRNLKLHEDFFAFLAYSPLNKATENVILETSSI